MPRNRVPLAKAKATGRTLHDPKRFKDRKEPVVKDPQWPQPFATLSLADGCDASGRIQDHIAERRGRRRPVIQILLIYNITATPGARR
jgi:hypothetical protein